MRADRHGLAAHFLDVLNILRYHEIEPAALARGAKKSDSFPLFDFVIEIFEMFDEDIRRAVEERGLILVAALDADNPHVEMVIPLGHLANGEDHRCSVLVTVSQS